MRLFKKLETELQRKPAFNLQRAKFTAKFLEKNMDFRGSILDIAEPNPMSKWLMNEMGITSHMVYNTASDLDRQFYLNRPSTGKMFKTVWCFEVIEHLMNPLLFLDNLRKFTTDDVEIFLSYPSRPKWLWNDKDHFHEYDKRRWELLLDKAGLEVVTKKPFYMIHWKLGIRPIIRNFLPVTTIYELRKK